MTKKKLSCLLGLFNLDLEGYEWTLVAECIPRAAAEYAIVDAGSHPGSSSGFVLLLDVVLHRCPCNVSRARHVPLQ